MDTTMSNYKSSVQLVHTVISDVMPLSKGANVCVGGGVELQPPPPLNYDEFGAPATISTHCHCHMLSASLLLLLCCHKPEMHPTMTSPG